GAAASDDFLYNSFNGINVNTVNGVSGVSATTGNVVLIGGGPTGISQNVTAGSAGVVTLSGTGASLAPGATVSAPAPAGIVTIDGGGPGNDLALGAGNISAGSSVLLANARNVSLGNVTASGALTATNIAGEITQFGGTIDIGTIVATTTGTAGTGQIKLDSPTNVIRSVGGLTTTDSPIMVRDAGAGGMNILGPIEAGFGSADIASNGHLAVNAGAPIHATGGVSLGAGGLLTVSAPLNGGNISLAADRMSLQGAPASIQAGPGQAISVQPKTTGWNIGLGGAASDLAANTLELSASELATLSTTGSLRIGSTFAGPGSVVSGNLFISGPIASAAGTLVLGSGGDIAQGSLGVVTADKLGLQALGNIDLSLASNQVANLAGHAGNGGTHSFKFVNGPDLHITNGLDANTDGLFGINGISVNFGPIAL